MLLHVGVQALLVDKLLAANLTVERRCFAVMSNLVPFDGIRVEEQSFGIAESAFVSLIASVLPEKLNIKILSKKLKLFYLK